MEIDIAQLVSTVGFPIAAYAAMFYYMVQKDKDHKEEINALKDSLNLNTQALSELKDLLTFLNKSKGE